YTIQASDDLITCTATATDIDGGSASDTATATVVNTDPVLSTVTISPSSANNDDTLSCSATATDADGGAPVVSYTWTGSASGSLGSGSTVDLSTTTAQGAETITCTATATDTDGGVDTGTASLSLDNRAPTVRVSLAPSSGATKNDTLTCTAVVADDDGDTLTTTFSWTVAGGSVTASSTSRLTSTLAGAFVAGNIVACTADTADGKGGTESASASTTIVNNPPTVSAVSLDKSTIYTNEALTASVTTSDADGDTVTVSYNWFVAGSSVQDGASETLNGASASAGFEKGEAVYVVVTASDGTDTATSTSTTLTVSNTPPGAPVVAIDPSDPEEGEDLFCEVTTESSDADGDPLTYIMSWTYDTTPYTGAITDVWTEDTVDGADTVGEEEWECTATPNDGDDDGETGSVSVTVQSGCDVDGDGYLSNSTECGGLDCDDDDASVYPFAGDSYGDGIDGDCDGMDCEGGYYGTAYFVSCPVNESWSDASQICTDAGYDSLASVLSAGEQSFLESLRPDSSVKYWLGLSDQSVEGDWGTWESGLPVTYTNWGSGEPNNFCDSAGCEDCLEMIANSYWNDQRCYGAHGLFCELR
ncbi:MAG TPA: hypothetical protein DFR83_12610, partial [Deltaproteobacteria bacterium]|nr:hypothetical protein [Deltaproteobacteria bacterium]